MFPVNRFSLGNRLFALTVAVLTSTAGIAAEFSVTPIRAELKSGALNETITVTNLSTTRLRVSVKLMEWTQDAAGNDVYKESSDLVYFPRQMELGSQSKRLVRVGAKSAAGLIERTYRLFLEEEPEPATGAARAQVAFYFRFGVPIFLTPALPKPLPEVLEPILDKGKLALVVNNTGNQHFRLTKLSVTDGAAYSQDIQGWYSLAGSKRTYSIEIPREVCRTAKTLSIALEGDGMRFDRRLNVDPASCT